jgi:lambda repressor-like predicted transcriptional regulator
MPADLAGADELDRELQALVAGNREHGRAPAPLVNDRPPAVGGQHEMLEHREMVLLRMLGYTVREIAERLGYTQVRVRDVLRTPWAREMLLAHLHKSNQNVLDLFQNELSESFIKVTEIRDDPNAPKAVQLKAAEGIINRYLGMPTQHVSMERKSAPTTREEAEKKLNELRAEQKRLLGN